MTVLTTSREWAVQELCHTGPESISVSEWSESSCAPFFETLNTFLSTEFTEPGPVHHVCRFSLSLSNCQPYFAAACAGFLNIGWGDDTIMATQFCAGGLHNENNFTKSLGFI